jgi:hypothetical protein
MDPAANCLTNGEGYATSWSARGSPTKSQASADAEYKGWHHEVPVRKPAPKGSDSGGGWFNNSTADATKGRGQRAGRPKCVSSSGAFIVCELLLTLDNRCTWSCCLLLSRSTWQDQNKGGDAMTGILGGGGGMSWGLGKTGDVKALLPSIANGSSAGSSPPGGGYSLVSANRSARLAGNSPRDVSLGNLRCNPSSLKLSFGLLLVVMLTVAFDPFLRYSWHRQPCTSRRRWTQGISSRPGALLIGTRSQRRSLVM